MDQFPTISKARTPTVSHGHGLAPATCGELVQGFLNGRDFLINSPIGLYAQVRVELDESGVIRSRTPGNFSKIEKAIAHTLALSGMGRQGVIVDIDSGIPRGKGMASSTAELVAAIRAIAHACGISCTETFITEILLHVDRSTDAVHIPGITMCDHLKGDILESFGPPPPLGFVIVDTGGEVDTELFDRNKARAIAKQNSGNLERALSLVRRGFMRQSSTDIALGATISARVNQEVLPKPLLEDLIEGTKAFGGLGVACAHTGTVLGVMFNPRVTEAKTLIDRILSLISHESLIGAFPLIEGGEGA